MTSSKSSEIVILYQDRSNIFFHLCLFYEDSDGYNSGTTERKKKEK